MATVVAEGARYTRLKPPVTAVHPKRFRSGATFGQSRLTGLGGEKPIYEPDTSFFSGFRYLTSQRYSSQIDSDAALIQMRKYDVSSVF